MEYSKYIDLGFDRIDISDTVEFKIHGYHGFILRKEINERMFIEVCSFELDKPILFIKRINSDCSDRVELTPKMVEGIFYRSKPIDVSYFNCAC